MSSEESSYPFTRAVRTESGGYVYPAAEKCIYCGAQDNLTKEHIVPYALFGDLIFPKSSCTECARVTSGIETAVLQKMLGVHRRALGFRSRKNRKRRNKIKAFISTQNADGTEKKIELAPELFPISPIALPIYDLPGFLFSAPQFYTRKPDRMELFIYEHEASGLLALGGGDRPVMLHGPSYHKIYFTRFLAKIAHGFATATLGDGVFEPILCDFIRIGDGVPSVFVGGELEVEAARSEVFELAFRYHQRLDGTLLLLVKIRLLAYMRAPTYIVVVGRGVPQDVTELRKCDYAKAVEFSVADYG